MDSSIVFILKFRLQNGVQKGPNHISRFSGLVPGIPDS
nr:MAG TPA: hypothetical protein [Caudoviricetes sp.]